MKSKSLRASFIAVASLFASFSTGTAFASLISIGAVPSTGAGLGAVNTLITFQNAGTEVGAVGLLPGGGGTEVTGSSVAFGIPGFPAPGGATHETGGNAGVNLYSASSLGLAAGGATTFSNLVLIFNGNEGGNAADQMITLSNLALNLFSSTGSLLQSFTTASAFDVTAFPGVGVAGFGFQLDAVQAAQANAHLAAAPNLIIGGAARATGASAGPETVFISTIAGDNGTGTPGVQVPDAGASIVLLGIAMLCLDRFRRKFAK